MPLDFAEPRKQGHEPAFGDYSAGDLGPLVNNTEEMRWKALMALTKVHLDTVEAGGEDTRELRAETGLLIFALGLAPQPQTSGHVTGPINVDCPQCKVPAGRRCVALASGDPIGHHHRARERRAAQARGAAA